MPRIKKAVVPTPRKEALPTLAKEIAFSQSALKKIEAEIEQRTQKLREGYAETIRQHQETIAECTSLLESYALEHRDQFDTKRSQDITHGVMGFRVSNPAVTIARGLSKKITGILEESGLTQFLRTKQELDKEKIIASRQDEDIMARLENIGITVSQKETFYFEPKEEELA